MKKRIKYTKMHGAGNSFVIIENLCNELEGENLSDLALGLCSEYNTDGMIVVIPEETADYGMLFYNSDGSMGEMCGNGARCLARYGFERGLSFDSDNIRFMSTAGIIYGKKITETEYQVRLNDPGIIDLGRRTQISVCSYIELGNPGIPHAVFEVGSEAFNDLDALRECGRALRNDNAFPKGANVTFAYQISDVEFRAITYERGVENFTLACGTACGALAAAMVLKDKVPGETVKIHMPGGILSISLKREGEKISNILLTGPTCIVEQGD